jgi:hypothetical protein
LGAHVKLSETERVVSAYVDGLKLADAGKPATYLQAIAELLSEFPDRSMADLVKCHRKVQQQSQAEPGPWNDEPRLIDIIPYLEALGRVLDAGRSPARRTKDLGLLIDLLQGSDGGRGDSRYLLPMLNALRQAMKPRTPEKTIQEFIDRLEAAKGSNRFDQVFSELASSDLRKEHVIEVARGVYGGVPSKLSRKAALAYVRKPHDAYMSAKRGIDATGGRSAA